MADEGKPKSTSPRLQRDTHNRKRVELLCEDIGYGCVMQLAEELWDAKQPGWAHSVGPCTFFLRSCRCLATTDSEPDGCDWCQGSRRVTDRVYKAMLVQEQLDAEEDA